MYLDLIAYSFRFQVLFEHNVVDDDDDPQCIHYSFTARLPHFSSLIPNYHPPLPPASRFQIAIPTPLLPINKSPHSHSTSGLAKVHRARPRIGQTTYPAPKRSPKPTQVSTTRYDPHPATHHLRQNPCRESFQTVYPLSFLPRFQTVLIRGSGRAVLYVAELVLRRAEHWGPRCGLQSCEAHAEGRFQIWQYHTGRRCEAMRSSG